MERKSQEVIHKKLGFAKDNSKEHFNASSFNRKLSIILKNILMPVVLTEN